MKRVTIRSTLGTLLIICFIILALSSKNCDTCYSAQAFMVKFFFCGIVLFAGGIYFARVYLKSEKFIFTIDTLPLLETDEATDGVPFSCEGIIQELDGKILSSPFTNTRCVYYHSIIEEYVKSGKNSRWVVRENLVNFVPFYLVDKRGNIVVDVRNLDNDFSGYEIAHPHRTVPDPLHSELDAMPALRHQEYSEGSKFFGITINAHKFRRSEYVLMPGTQVFVHGFVSRRGRELVVHESDRHPLIVSTKTKKAYVNEFYKGQSLVYLVHLLAAVGFTLSFLSLHYFLKLNMVLFFSVLNLGNGLILGSIFFTIYNRLVTLKERAETALSTIDIELKRRSELIPRIVSLVAEYTKHEKEIQQAIASTRADILLQKQMPTASPAIDTPLLAILEKYPTLRASENYQELAKTLVDTEERIAYSREFYNRSVRKLNILIGQFPFNAIAKICTIRDMKFIAIAPSGS